MNLSYAQNYEDVMLKRALKDIERGFYIDVGANSPEVHSITKIFYDSGWVGINIEPLINNHNTFVLNRPLDTNLNCAISHTNGSMDIWESEDELGGLATLDKSIAAQHEKNGFKGKWNKIDVITLNDLFSNLDVNEVHFLKIDVEGFERQVIEGNDWCKNRPWIVVVEATKPLTQEESHHEWEPIIVSNRYHLVYKDGLNRFYVADEKSYLDKKFEFPPNVFDDFVKIEPYYEDKINSNHILIESLEERNRDLDSHIDSIYRSLSWRLTKPLRLMKEYFKR